MVAERRGDAAGNRNAYFPGSAMRKRLIAIWVALAVATFTVVYLFTYQEKLKIDLDRVAYIRQTLYSGLRSGK